MTLEGVSEPKGPGVDVSGSWLSVRSILHVHGVSIALDCGGHLRLPFVRKVTVVAGLMDLRIRGEGDSSRNSSRDASLSGWAFV